MTNVGDGGIMLNGLTVSQLQHSVHVSRAKDPQSGQALPFMNFLDPRYLANSAGGANAAYIMPNTTPGTFGLLPYLYGPRQFSTDLSLIKHVPIKESIRFTFQTEFLNAFNHTNFTFNSNCSDPNACGFNIQNPSFGTLGPLGNARAIEMRANLEF